MSDPASALRPVLEAALRADAGVNAAFQGKRVKIYGSLPPVNAAAPYIYLAGLSCDDRLADCYDAATVSLQIDVWSLTDPPGFDEAERIAAAVKACLATMTTAPPALVGHRIVSVLPLSTDYLTDPSDGMTVHAVIRADLTIDPVA